MRVFSKERLTEYRTKHAGARLSLETRLEKVALSDWSTPQEVLYDYPRASIVGDGRVIFRLQGNKYRLVTDINYPKKVIDVVFIGTHTDYDRIDVRTIGLW